MSFNDYNGMSSGSGILNKSLPQSPASMVSSESETQSISDEQTPTIARSTAKSSRKSSASNERPPWRTVIIAPPQKVNKNALLKAKILDATRRALLAQKINHIGTQTDAYATMLREKATSVQKDLILMLDKSADTDGTVIVIKDRLGGLIITQTVGQMTDLLPSTTIATQTPLPKTHLSFASLANGRVQADPDFSQFEQQMLESELVLQIQRNALKTIDSKLNESRVDKRISHGMHIQCENNTPNGEQYDSRSRSHSPSTSEITQQRVKIDEIAVKMRENSINSIPSMCWEEFDFSDSDNDFPDFPRRTISDGGTPWNNFKELIVGQRMASMTLTPIKKKSAPSKKKCVTWNERQLAVTKLINESSALIEVSIMIGPEMNLKLPKDEKNLTDMNIPNSKWEPILKNSCKDLEEMLINYKPRNHPCSSQLKKDELPEYF